MLKSLVGSLKNILSKRKPPQKGYRPPATNAPPAKPPHVGPTVNEIKK